MRKKVIAFAWLCLYFLAGIAQVVWKNIPRDDQFVCRNVSSNKGKIVFEGMVTQAGYSSLQIIQLQNGGGATKYIIPLTYNGAGQAYFNYNLSISSGKISHRFELSINDAKGNKTLDTIHRVVCGDAYLITGQSNSVANAYNGFANPLYQDSFIRSFGSSYPSAFAALNDTGWYKADGDGLYIKACVGQWGLVFARKILDSAGIPVCIINAGVGGTPISFHQKNPLNGEDLNSNYGRMLYRAKKAGLHDKIRGIFWFQGESDGSNAQLHDSLFRKMWTDWIKDYSGLEKIAVVQVRTGCGAPSMELREKQRRMQELNKTVVISANGLNTHDGCHYEFKDGYEKLGLLLFHQLKTSLYKIQSTPNNQPLNPYVAYFSNAYKSEICVEFTPLNATLKADPNFHQLFSLSGGTATITSGVVRNNKVYLALSKSECAAVSLNYEGLIGKRPWVTTIADATLITFWRFPVLKTQPLNAVGVCKGISVTLGNDSVPGLKYFWKGVLSGKTSTKAKPILNVSQSERFNLFMTTKAVGCPFDTLYQNVIIDTVSKPDFKEAFHICKHDSLLIGQKNTDWQTASWRKGSLVQDGFWTYLRDTGMWVFSVQSPKGCKAADTILLKHFIKQGIAILDSIEVCENSSKIIHAIIGKNWNWNGIPGIDSFSVSGNSKRIVLGYTDSLGCLQQDSCRVIRIIPGSTQIDSHYSICKGDTLKLFKPAAFNVWSLKGQILDSSLALSGPINGLLEFTDNKGCKVHQQIGVGLYPETKIALSDTGICEGDMATYSINIPLKLWRWSNGSVNGVFKTTAAGLHRLIWLDSNGCSGNVAFNVKVASRVTFNLPMDTQFCKGDSLILGPSVCDAPSLWINNQMAILPTTIKQPGIYLFEGFYQSYCQNKHTLNVAEITCRSGVAGIEQMVWDCKVVDGGMLIVNQTGNSGQISLYDAQGKLLQVKYIGAHQELIIKTTSNGVFFVGFAPLNSRKPGFKKLFIP